MFECVVFSWDIKPLALPVRKTMDGVSGVTDRGVKDHKIIFSLVF